MTDIKESDERQRVTVANRRTFEGVVEFFGRLSAAGAIIGRADTWIALDSRNAAKALDTDDWDALMRAGLERADGNAVTSVFGGIISNDEHTFIEIRDDAGKSGEDWPYLRELISHLEIPRLQGDQLLALAEIKVKLEVDIQLALLEHREHLFDALLENGSPKRPTMH